MLKQIIINLLSDPVTWFCILSLVLAVFVFIAKKTKTTKDDAAAKIITGFIHNAFNTAEKFIPDGSTGKLGKIDVALKEFNSKYEARFGEAPTEDLKEVAKAEWSILATQIKKAKG